MADLDERIDPFPPVPRSEWVAKVEADLKGAAFDKLRSTTAGGLTVEPLYTADDAVDAQQAGLPGLFPFVRGSSAVGGWTIRQEYDDPRPSVCKAMIETDLARGVEALWLRLGPRGGVRVLTVDELDQLLAPVDLERTSVWVDGGSDALAVASGFLSVARRRGVEISALRGGLGFDPVGLLAGDGGIHGGLRARMAELRDLAAWCAEHAPGLRAVHVSGSPYDNAGASEVQELAYTLATGLEYLRQLVDAGLTVDAAAAQLAFSYGISSDFFTQVAKLRAARWAWAKVVKAAGGDGALAAMHIHGRTSPFTMAFRDPWVNMLRVTAECTAAILGGAQSISTLPFDYPIGPADDLSLRVARNTQLVLRDESHLGEVADPAGGSWYVERLTEDLARAAWEELQSIERDGGILEALGSGTLVDRVSAVAEQRRKRIATRKTPIVGVSEFPNLEEDSVRREPVTSDEIHGLLERSLQSIDLETHRDQLLKLARRVNETERPRGSLTEACLEAMEAGADMYSVATVLQHGQPDFHVEPVAAWRQSDAWERLRDRSDRADSRPTAFLANLGPIPAHKARSAWAQNLLAAAGIAAPPNDGFDGPDALSSGWSSSGASLAVVCGSDADYESSLEPSVAALKAAGCPVVLVAGRPGEREAALREAGVSDFVFVGADVLDVMSRLLDGIGVER